MEYHKIDTPFVRDKQTFKVKMWEYRNPVFALINDWQWTEKIDGTNIRIQYYPLDRTYTVRGRTDNAQLNCDLVDAIRSLVDVDRFAALADRWNAKKIVVYGEGYGAGIQKGGGLYSQRKQFIAFDILINDTFWLGVRDCESELAALGLPQVPLVGYGPVGMAIALCKQGFNSLLPGPNGGPSQHQAEGVVGRTVYPLFDSFGKRLIVKLKTTDFEHESEPVASTAERSTTTNVVIAA